MQRHHPDRTEAHERDNSSTIADHCTKYSPYYSASLKGCSRTELSGASRGHHYFLLRKHGFRLSTYRLVFDLVLLNTGRFGVHPFDPFPYGLLTMVVSLEAIFLSTFVLITQNRLGDEVEHRADLDLHIGLLAEHELTRVLQMLDAIQEKLGVENHATRELPDLEMETKPEDVLAEIARLQRSPFRKRSPLSDTPSDSMSG